MSRLFSLNVIKNDQLIFHQNIHVNCFRNVDWTQQVIYTGFKIRVLKQPHEYDRPCEIHRKTRTNEIYIRARSPEPNSNITIKLTMQNF